jgi:predicted amidophosphoribosyltransferase
VIERDDIDDLVDWQLSAPPERRHVCRSCRASWTGTPTICPECGTPAP